MTVLVDLLSSRPDRTSSVVVTFGPSVVFISGTIWKYFVLNMWASVVFNVRPYVVLTNTRFVVLITWTLAVLTNGILVLVTTVSYVVFGTSNEAEYVEIVDKAGVVVDSEGLFEVE